MSEVPESTRPPPIAPGPLPVESPPPPAALRSGVWTIIGQLVVALVVIILLQAAVAFVAAVGLSTAAAMNGEPSDPDVIGTQIGELVTSPLGISGALLISETVFLVTALLAVRRFPGRRHESLGLGRPQISAAAYGAFALGAMFVAALAEMLAQLVTAFYTPGLDAEALRDQVTWTTGIVFVVCVTFPPGFVEELLFRGYVQRRLLRRWRPFAAILFASVAFAIAHLDPLHVVFALPLGIWLGLVAWRTGSIWPGVVCHAFINFLWNVWGICAVKLEIPAEHVALEALGIWGAGAVGFLIALVLLVRMPPAVVLARPAAVLDTAGPYNQSAIGRT